MAGVMARPRDDTRPLRPSAYRTTRSLCAWTYCMIEMLLRCRVKWEYFPVFSALRGSCIGILRRNASAYVGVPQTCDSGRLTVYALGGAAVAAGATVQGLVEAGHETGHAGAQGLCDFGWHVGATGQLLEEGRRLVVVAERREALRDGDAVG